MSQNPMIVVLMGVSGSGKTTIGKLLAKRTGAIFADGDDYHPAANKEKMHAGHPLNDEDRQPWLERLNVLLRDWREHDQSGILACSALKEKYRQMLFAHIPEGVAHFVLLDGSRELIAQRLKRRNHEFMSASLLDSQFATLEEPQNAIRVQIDKPADAVVTQIMERLGVEEKK